MTEATATRTDALLEELRAEGEPTWFDLGLLLDRVRDGRAIPSARAPAGRRAFGHHLARGVAFVTFEYAIDGVTMEIVKYASALSRVLPDPEIHLVGGRFDPRVDAVIDPAIDRHTIESLCGFDACPIYRPFFQRRLERGSRLYNRLVKDYWQLTLEIVDRLGRLFERNDIQLVVAVNTNSNPGNPALALALVLLSERLGIPVIANNHDYYWEGGHSEHDRARLGLAKGPRDHFFTNAHLGEVFSMIEMTHPWEGRSWLSLNLSQRQSDTLIERFGQNPANVAEIGTAVDTETFAPVSRPRRMQVLQQLALLLDGKGHEVPVRDIRGAIDEGLLAAPPHVPVLLGRGGPEQIDFTHDNLILLQPTRIIARKQIGLDFELLARLFSDPAFTAALEQTPGLKVTVLVTGPVADGQQRYFDRLLEFVARKMESLPEPLQGRMYFAPLFAGLDSAEFRRSFDKPASVAELYGAASLVCLPSETEGRGLPIVEAAASGVPIFVRRYEPEDVYTHVIGEHLAREHRLDVIEFEGTRVSSGAADRVRDLLLHPQDHAAWTEHNRRVAERRYSMDTLVRDLDAALQQLRRQLRTSGQDRERARDALARFRRRMHGAQRRVGDLLDDRNREYLPGYGRLGFMLMLKSLIDPSYFRVEEQRIRGMVFAFARSLEGAGPASSRAARMARLGFYDAVDSLFTHYEGEMEIMFDHAMAYRHRHRRAYPYRGLTLQELCGVVNGLHQELGTPREPVFEPDTVRHFSSWGRAMERLCTASLAIDQRDRLHRALGESRPIAFFPGSALALELELFVLQAVRLRLGLKDHDSLTADALRYAELPPIHLVVRESPCGAEPTVAAARRFVKETPNEELRLVFEHRACRIVSGRHLAPGVDVREIGGRAAAALRDVAAGDGFVLACAGQAAATLDILGMERFVVGRASDPFEAGLLEIEEGEGFVQWLPAGLRFALAYPTPVQTGRSLARTLEGKRFNRLCARQGEETVLAALRDDADERGSPVERVLDGLEGKARRGGARVEQQAVGGLYADGNPWSGNLARLRGDAKPLRYRIVSADDRPRTVVDFVRDFADEASRRAQIAWNGGYILNAELVGKLGLPERYIGSPLGLIVSGGRVLCPPLYRKPAFLVGEDGRLEIRRVSAEGGLRVRCGHDAVTMAAAAHDPETPPDGPCYYDLCFSDEAFPGRGRTLVRLAGTRIMEIVESGADQDVPVFPVGLTLSFPPGGLPASFAVDAELEMELPALGGIAHAVEAGPLLVEDGEVCIDMAYEGWTTENSIRTQAARMDYLDMRGPKIAVGLGADGGLSVLTINGRIRESVGATHVDMAEIMQSLGCVTAMGFDPGGSSTLVVGGEAVNISPYNPGYEQNVWSMPPCPRPVSNAVIGY